MPISLNHPPYIFTTQTVFRAGRPMRLMVQFAGKPGDVGRILPAKNSFISEGMTKPAQTFTLGHGLARKGTSYTLRRLSH